MCPSSAKDIALRKLGSKSYEVLGNGCKRVAPRVTRRLSFLQLYNEAGRGDCLEAEELSEEPSSTCYLVLVDAEQLEPGSHPVRSGGEFLCLSICWLGTWVDDDYGC